MNKSVDVVVLTKNSERLLRECFDSVYRNVPVSRLIVVDGHSTDRTPEIVEEFQKKHGNVVFLQVQGTRGSARQKAMEIVETEWFMFVDSDVLLSKNWFVDAQKLVKEDVGAVWGIEIWSILTKMKLLGLFQRVTLKIFDKRGGTHDLLVRRKAIEGIRVPHHLHTYEDAFIKSWILKKGYKVVGSYEPYCMHFRPNTVWTIRQSIALIASDIRKAIWQPSLILSYELYTIIVLRYMLLNKFLRKQS
jgi:glycosyltransferase involved in cell wall biosynthesis